MADHSKIIKRIIEGLKTLANSQFDSEEEFVKISTIATNILFEVYKAGVSNTTFTSEEKRTIGPLIPLALQGLAYKLSILHVSFSSNSIDSLRIQRSGLQFFIDIFKDFPASTEDESESLEKILKEFLEREGVDALDDRLRTAEFDPYCDDGERSASLQAEIAKLPSTHWWFFE